MLMYLVVLLCLSARNVVAEYESGVIIATDAGSGGSRQHLMIVDNDNGKILKNVGATRLVTKTPSNTKPMGKAIALMPQTTELKKHTDAMVDGVGPRFKAICYESIVGRPADERPECTGSKWYIRATAGMREVHRRQGASSTTEIWAAVVHQIQQRLLDNFRISKDALEVVASTIEGWKEAQYDYKAVKTQLTHNVNGDEIDFQTHNGKAPVVLDLGGASTQFVLPEFTGASLISSLQTSMPQRLQQDGYTPINAAGETLVQNADGKEFAADEVVSYYYKQLSEDDAFAGSLLAASGPFNDGDIKDATPAQIASAGFRVDPTTLPFPNEVDGKRASNLIGGLMNTGLNVFEFAPECMLTCETPGQPKCTKWVSKGETETNDCFDKIVTQWSADPFVANLMNSKELKEYIEDASSERSTILIANFGQMASLLGCTEEQLADKTLAEFQQTAREIWSGDKHLGYQNEGYGYNAPVVSLYFWFLLSQVYGYPDDKPMGAMHFNWMDKYKRSWIDNDEAQGMSWVGGIVTEETGHEKFYALESNIQRLEQELQEL